MSEIDFAIGILGAISQLVVFALNLNGKLRNNSFAYVGTNALGAMMTSYYAIVNNDVPFLMLEATWCLFAFLKLREVLRKKKRKRE